MKMIADLDEQLLRCRPGASKAYAEEAVATYRAGAYRSCIVTTWIAVVFDIIDKMREAALFGNAEIKQKLEDFDRWQSQISSGNKAVLSQALAFEREILDYAHKKLEFIDGQQLIDLERLQDDRNRCAHPTFQREAVPYQPSGEIARAHLCHAMQHLLQQPPVQGRAALFELRRILASDYFPRDVAPAKKELEEGLLVRTSAAFTRGAVDEILHGFFQEGNSYYRDRRIPAALGAIVEITRDVSERRLSEQFPRILPRLADKELPYAISLVIRIPECARALSDVHYEKLRGVLRDDKLSVVAPLFEGASRVPKLQAAVRDRVGKMSVEELAARVKAGLRGAAVEPAVAFYCKSGSWDRANYITEALILPLLPYLKREHIEKVLRSPDDEKSDLRGSFGFGQFLEKIRTEKVIDPQDLDSLLRAHGFDIYIPDTSESSDNADDPAF
jgi:hypothetical protein